MAGDDHDVQYLTLTSKVYGFSPVCGLRLSVSGEIVGLAVSEYVAPTLNIDGRPRNVRFSVSLSLICGVSFGSDLYLAPSGAEGGMNG